MSIRCRACGMHFPSEAADYPRPERLATLAPYMGILVEAAAEYDRVGAEGDPGTALDFTTWLEVDVLRAAGLLPKPKPTRGMPGVTIGRGHRN
jgi:hypothetical protein